MSDIKVDATAYQKFSEFKVEFNKLNLKKSGHNEFQNFDYYELGDFSPQADEILNKHGLVYVGPERKLDENGVPCYVGRIVDFYGNEANKISMKIEESNSTKNPTQNEGGTLKYYRRYLKSACIELCEQDEIDSKDNSKNEPTVESKATKKQLELIAQLYDTENIEKILNYYQVTKLEDLTVKQASTVLAKKGK